VFLRLISGLSGIGEFAGVVILIGYLLSSQSGWRRLARRYRAAPPFAGVWRRCRAAVMSTEALDSPGYRAHRVRLDFVLRVGVDAEALFVSAMPLFAPLFPPVRIPWQAIARVRYFDPSGWYSGPQRASGFVFQLTYDPGYTGHFVEIEVAEPRTFLQVPVAAVADAVSHFPAPPAAVDAAAAIERPR
jgi:hypothetical protein